MSEHSVTAYRILLRRALRTDDFKNVQLHFEVAVLQSYVGVPGFSVIRTNTVGRIRKQGGWSIDFGIAPDEQVIHISQADVARIPMEDRDHWADHAIEQPSSRMFLQMRMSPGSCFDDGDVRNWE
ncbi:MAG: hypothetical protein AB7P33_10975 [Dehalococcoidia bacterium]